MTSASLRVTQHLASSRRVCETCSGTSVSQSYVDVSSAADTKMFWFSGQLKVSWVPFQTSSQDHGAAGNPSSSIIPSTSTCVGTTWTSETSSPAANSPAALLTSSSASSSSSTSSTVAATPPACLTSACRPFPQTGATCSSAPVNVISASGQVCLPVSSPLFTISGLCSAAPPTVSLICPTTQTPSANPSVLERHVKDLVCSSGKFLNSRLVLPPPPTSLYAVAPPISTCMPLQQSETTGDTVSLLKSLSHQVHPPHTSASPLCCQKLKQSNVPFVASNTFSVLQPVQPLSSLTTIKTVSHLNTTLSQVQIKHLQPVSVAPQFSLVTPAGPCLSYTVQTVVPASHPKPPRPVLPSTSRPPALLPAVPQTSSAPENTCSKQQDLSLLSRSGPGEVGGVSGRAEVLPVATAENEASAGPSHDTQPNGKHPPNLQTLTEKSSDWSSPKHEQQSLVVKAVADSACDHGVQQVETRQQESAENEPSSTVCEESEAAASVCETSDSESEEPAAVIGRQDCSSSQWPKVLVFRLPVPPARPGRPLPAFRLVHGNAKNEIYLEEMSEDAQVGGQSKPSCRWCPTVSGRLED